MKNNNKEVIKNPLKGIKFNGKIYGGKGSYHIYIQNEKVTVSNEQKVLYDKYVEEFQKLKDLDKGVLLSPEISKANIEIGNESEHYELTFEQLKKKLELFKVEVVAEGNKKGVDYLAEKCTLNGKFIGAMVLMKKGEREKKWYLNEERLDDFLKNELTV